jgi:orotidine-5'-phosphate decarboxylase
VDQLLVALDVEEARRALALADSLRGIAGAFKIGSRLFTAEGPAIVRALVERGDRVFLDLKYHDIPNIVGSAVAEAAALGVWMLTVHTAGGSRMMKSAVDRAKETAERLGSAPPLVIGVTVLTSMNTPALAETGVPAAVFDQVVTLATLAKTSGLDGVVASPQETAMIRERCGPSFTIVTPGIRGSGAPPSSDDQERTMAPGDAIEAGASYIVVGRPIIGAADPRAAAERMVEEIKGRRKKEEG